MSFNILETEFDYESFNDVIFEDIVYALNNVALPVDENNMILGTFKLKLELIEGE